jgi:predicted DsbA family dithiol-disulfide isomerase
VELIQEDQIENTGTKPTADRVEIVVYSDPLCCWSYALETQLNMLREAYDGKLHMRYCMAGMIPDWHHYKDDVNAVSKPIQMGPLWMEARELTGTYLYERIWIEDPPASSYPACIAVKCAELQSTEAANTYLQLLYKAVMTEGKNISRNSVLLEVAGQMVEGFDVQKFQTDLLSGAGKPLFKKDLEEVRMNQVSRFPTVTCKNEIAGIIITGYRKFDYLSKALQKLL